MNQAIVMMIRASGRSWWQACYSDGKVLSEWDTFQGPEAKLKLPLGTVGFNFGNSSRWEEVSKNGMVALRLLCPNGMAGELEAPEGHRFFQIKHGGIDVPMSGGHAILSGLRRYTDAHIIGVIRNDEGDCVCRSWEFYARVTSPEFEKAELIINQLANEDDIRKAKENLARFHAMGYGKWRWRLIEFADNIHHMEYRHIGALFPDVQQMKV